MRRLIQIQDAHPEAVQIWLGFLQKHAFHGVGMKANIWEYSSLEVGKDMDKEADSIAERVQKRMEFVGRREDLADAPDTEKMVHDAVFKGSFGGMAPLGPHEFVPPIEQLQK